MAVKKYLSVNEYYLKFWVQGLKKATGGDEHYDNVLVEKVVRQINLVIQNAKMVPLMHAESEGVTKKDVIESLGIKGTYDTALPQEWVDRMHLIIGESPIPHFVWLYDGTVGGRPFPITSDGEVMLRISNYVDKRIV